MVRISCGVLVLVRDSLEFEMKSIITDDNGRYILLNAKVQGSDYILGNIYAPNKIKEQCNFFVELQQKLDDFITIQDQRIIIGGDFNVIMDQNLDCADGSPKKKESVKFLNDICLNYDLIDIWRTRNPDSTLFTWRQKKPLIQRRLDFWLISDFCQDEVEETSIKTAIRTDHSAIIISFNSLDEPRRGPSYWKFNSSLIEDENYVSVIEQKIPEWLEEFIDVTDKRVLWDLIKYHIRQFTMKYSKKIAFKRKQELLQIEASIKQAEETLISDPSASNLEALEKLKNKYDSHFDYIAKGAIVRPRATWYEQGEKSLNKDIHGIMVGNEEIKLEIFADDMTAFLRDHASLDTLLNMVDSFSLHSGLKINFEKTEVLFLGNDQKSTMETVISLARNRNITAKKAIKILGVHFTYDQTLWRKLNFDETMKTIKERLNCWNWRNLTVLGRIQIIKSFVIPVFMYRAGLVCSHKEIVKEVNKIIFNFIWKGKDKVKRSALISDVENGGLSLEHHIWSQLLKHSELCVVKNSLILSKAVGK